MIQKFTIKEIAFQAGLSAATVDRALHARSHVRQITKDRVAAAIEELERQYAASRIEGRRFTIDVFIQSPRRFSSAVRAAFEAELPLVKPASIRARFHLFERIDDRDIVAKLKAIARRGSHGIVLKCPATPRIEACLSHIAERGIPVVTYVTDVADPLRLAYVGMENRKAGATAAYLMQRMRQRNGGILITLSSQLFLGEEQRRVGFADHMARHLPDTPIKTVSEGLGVNKTTKASVFSALAQNPDITCVYSIGGGNRAVLEAFSEAGRDIDVFAAHDLDDTNRRLLGEGSLSFVLHHDFRQDARRVALHLLKYHKLLPADVSIEETEISIACPLL